MRAHGFTERDAFPVELLDLSPRSEYPVAVCLPRIGPSAASAKGRIASRWHKQIGDPTLAGIFDRLVHNAHLIEMRGDSMRKNRGKPTVGP